MKLVVIYDVPNEYLTDVPMEVVGKIKGVSPDMTIHEWWVATDEEIKDLDNYLDD